MQDQRFSIVRAGSLYLGPRRGLLGTLVSEKNLFDRYTLETFEQDPVTSKKAGGAATGVEGDENVLCMGSNMFEYHIIGTQTILAPVLAANGLAVTMDETTGDGIELTQGILARSKQAMVIGTDAFYLKCRAYIETVAECAELAVGFRKAEAYQALIDNYVDMAVLNSIIGTITIETIVGGAATTSTSTTDTWADGESHTLEVYVSRGGVVTYKIDGVAPTVTAAFTFTDALTVVPFFHFLHGGTPAAVVIRSWECGLQ